MNEYLINPAVRVIRGLSMTLPMPPTVNHYYQSRGKQRFLSDAAKAFRVDVVAAFYQRGKFAPFSGPLRLSAVLSFATRRECDLDNRVKSLQDALQWAGFYESDSQIDILRVIRGPLKRGGQCFVCLEEIEIEKRRP
jgi:crossover junction endodeoxyribonuclease RusA